jgi:uncharacterized Fe-S cluster protein YjdI
MKEQNDESEDIRGNFAMGTCFGDVRCVHGHPVRLFNIRRGHWVACDKCRTYIFVGSNLMSSWRSETDDAWQANDKSVWGYRCIE